MKNNKASVGNHHIAIYWLPNHRLKELNLGRLSEERSDRLSLHKNNILQGLRSEDGTSKMMFWALESKCVTIFKFDLNVKPWRFSGILFTQSGNLAFIIFTTFGSRWYSFSFPTRAIHILPLNFYLSHILLYIKNKANF